jgi:hypothetical protein
MWKLKGIKDLKLIIKSRINQTGQGIRAYLKITLAQ